MSYTKVSTIITDGDQYVGTGNNPDAWKYFFETFLPTVGWTVTLTDQASANPPSANTSNHWYFLKKTLTFTDGTTDTISYALQIEMGARRHRWYAWDGVKATNDSTDADYGRGGAIGTHPSSSFLSTGAATWDIWKDANSDSWVWLKNGRFYGCWLPNGGWVRQDNVHIVDRLFNHNLLLPIYQDNGQMCSDGTNSTGLNTSLPVDTPNSNKLTNYISLQTRTGKAVWLGTSNDMLMRASGTELHPDPGAELLQVGSSAPYDYYYGLTSNVGGKGLYFNFGTTDPGY